jgi:hypothetical protein
VTIEPLAIFYSYNVLESCNNKVSSIKLYVEGSNVGLYVLISYFTYAIVSVGLAVIDNKSPVGIFTEKVIVVTGGGTS